MQGSVLGENHGRYRCLSVAFVHMISTFTAKNIAVHYLHTLACKCTVNHTITQKPLQGMLNASNTSSLPGVNMQLKSETCVTAVPDAAWCLNKR